MKAEEIYVNTGGNTEKIFVFELTRNGELTWVDSKTKKVVLPTGQEDVKLIDEVYDPEVKRFRTICYNPGEGSIFLDEQIDKDRNKSTIAYMEFIGGIAFVKESEMTMLQFLKMAYLNNENEGKERPSSARPIMRKRKPAELARQLIDKESSIIEAKAIAFTGDWEDVVKPYALAHGLDMTKTPKEIRYHISTMIDENNSDDFIKNHNSKEIKSLALVEQRIMDKIIGVDKSARKIFWVDNKETIIGYRMGVSAKEALASYLLTPEGLDLHNDLKNRITGSGITSGSTPVISSADILSYDAEKAVELGIKEELIKQGNDKVYRYKSIKCGSTNEKIVEHFNNNEAKLVSLREELVALYKEKS